MPLLSFPEPTYGLTALTACGLTQGALWDLMAARVLVWADRKRAERLLRDAKVDLGIAKAEKLIWATLRRTQRKAW